jgi:hypothetical protein
LGNKEIKEARYNVGPIGIGDLAETGLDAVIYRLQTEKTKPQRKT